MNCVSIASHIVAVCLGISIMATIYCVKMLHRTR